MDASPAASAVPQAAGLPPPKAWLALLLGLIASPVAFLYVGRARLAIAFFAVPLLLIPFMGWTGLIFTPVRFYATALLLLAVAIVAWLWPFFVARRWHSGSRTARYHRLWIYLLVALVTSLFRPMLIGHRAELFGWEPFRVPSGAMRKTIAVGDFLLADGRHNRPPAVGDIVIYRSNHGDKPLFVKRLMALPGDRIAMRQCKVILNGVAMQEPYVLLAADAEKLDQGICNWAELTLGADEIFLLGDNRLASADSRGQGPSHLADIKARARFIWWSRDRDRIGRRLD